MGIDAEAHEVPTEPGQADVRHAPCCADVKHAELHRAATAAAGVEPPEQQQCPPTARTGEGAATLASEGLNPQIFQGEIGWNPWSFNPAMSGVGPELGGFGGVSPPWMPMLQQMPNPYFLPLPLPEQAGQPGVLVAVPLFPIYGPMGGVPSSPFMPMMFTMPMGAPMVMEGFIPGTAAGAGSERQTDGREEVPNANGLQQRQGAPAPAWGGAAQRAELQRQVVRRFRVGFQLDLLLLLKLAVVVFVFNQDGSKDRLFLLLFLAAVVYLYQTGALTPLLRWISQCAQRAMMPPPPPPNPAAPEGQPGGDGPRVGPAGVPATDQEPGGRGVGEAGDGEANAGLGGNGPRRPPPEGNWWGLFKEVQMLVVGFVTSLLPGFQQAE